MCRVFPGAHSSEDLYMKRTTRILCLLLALCMMVPMVQSMRLQVHAYASAKPLPELTGNKGQDVANVAISQLGYHEASDGGTVYGAWWTGVTNWGYDYTRAGWCSIFAMWCAQQAGAGMNIAFDKRGAVPANCMNWLLTNASGDTTFSVAPAPGDFIFFSTGSTAQHVAIVVAYDRATNKVTFVGGNQGNAVTQFTMLYTASALYGSQRIIGIGRPNYGESVIVPTCSCDEAFAGHYQCITQTDSLNIRSGHGTAFSVVGTIPPGAIVYVSKAQGISDESWAHVEYNGVKGYCAMQYLKRAPEYEVEIVYDDHTGDAIGANVEIFDYVTVDEMTMTLPEQFSVTASVSPLIHISAKNGFLLHLEIPLSGDSTGVAPAVLDALGQAVALEEYEFTEVGIRVSVAGSIDLVLTYTAPEHTHSYSSRITTQPACETAGERTYTCECGHSYTEAMDATGHTGETLPGKAPTPTEPGLTDGVICTACQKILTPQQVLPATGYTVSGSLTTFGSTAEEVTISLIPSGQTQPAQEITLSGSADAYAITGLTSGEYTLRVMKKNHVTREYAVAVSGENVVLNAKIHLLGDLDGDGRVRSNDLSLVYSHASGSSAITDPYILGCADVNADGRIRSSDVSRILSHIVNTNPLW